MSTQEVTDQGALRQAQGTRNVRAAVLAHLRDPMRRSSYALILGTGLTSAFGLLFWILAARWLPAATVGIGAALVSATALLANLSTLGLRNGIVRFLPEAGAASRRLIATAYALCGAAAMVTAAIFLLGQPVWAEKLGFLRSTPLASAVFVVSVGIWVIFVLQDNVLLALRRAEWVPLVNGICSVAKIAILPVLAFSTVWAIFTATVLPAAVAVLVVTALVLRRPAQAPEPSEPISLGRLVRFAATDHLAALLWMGTSDLLTLLILQQVGAEASAYYFIASTIGYSLYLIISNVGSALVAEGARHPDRTVTLARQALVNAARLVIPLALVGSLLAPVLLGLLGPDYAENGTLLLQLILVSAVPQLLVAVAMSTARLRHDLKLIIGIYAAQTAGMLGGSWLLIGIWGLTGAGVAIVSTASLLALALLLSGRTGLWDDRELHGGSAALRRLGTLRRRRRSRNEARQRVAPALEALGISPIPDAYDVLTSECDTVIVGLPGRPELAKISTSPAATAGLDRHADMLDALHTDPAVGHLRSLLPTVVRRGAVDGERVVLETRLPGRPATGGEADTEAALTGVADLHTATARSRNVDADLLNAWIDEPLAELRRVPSLAGSGPALDRIAHRLRSAFDGREVMISLTHGDFWPGNVLVTGPAADPQLTAIVDWENARREGLPDTDLLHWWLTSQPVELGTAVAGVLDAPEQVADLPPSLPNPQVALSSAVLLTWLWHVSAGLTRATRNPLSRVWLARNVRPILRRFEPSRRAAKANAKAMAMAKDGVEV